MWNGERAGRRDYLLLLHGPILRMYRIVRSIELHHVLFPLWQRRWIWLARPKLRKRLSRLGLSRFEARTNGMAMLKSM